MGPTPSGVEVWCCNDYRSYLKRHPRVIKEDEWTRWFNLHSREHMDRKYPGTVGWYKLQTKPIYLQLVQPDIPASTELPRKRIQNSFKINGKPNRYFNCTVTWQLPYALLEGFKRVELWGFMLRDTKAFFEFERPSFFYWVKVLQDAGVDVIYQEAIRQLPFKPGDPAAYTGPLYGYGTKPEKNWNNEKEEFN